MWSSIGAVHYYILHKNPPQLITSYFLILFIKNEDNNTNKITNPVLIIIGLLPITSLATGCKIGIISPFTFIYLIY